MNFINAICLRINQFLLIQQVAPASPLCQRFSAEIPTAKDLTMSEHKQDEAEGGCNISVLKPSIIILYTYCS
jgi:hypothetical protein